jgi:MYXO-CTERM domain-containing protein
MRTSRTLQLGFATLLGGLATLLTVSAAQAQECTSNDDCSDGFECIKGMSSPGCATPPDCPDPTPIEDEVGWCERTPQICETDEDCSSFLKCVANESSTCWVDSEGNSGCEPEDPNAQKTCSYVPLSCEVNEDCPDSFECTEMGVPCAAPECLPGTECLPVDCGEETEKICTPKQITCAVQDDCPTDWLCADVTPDCASPPPDDGTEPERPQDETDCETATPIMACIPPGFSAGVDFGGQQESGATPTTNRSDDGTETEGGLGCAMSSSQGTGGWLAVIGIAGIASLVSRRRRRN